METRALTRAWSSSGLILPAPARRCWGRRSTARASPPARTSAARDATRPAPARALHAQRTHAPLRARAGPPAATAAARRTASASAAAAGTAQHPPRAGAALHSTLGVGIRSAGAALPITLRALTCGLVPWTVTAAGSVELTPIPILLARLPSLLSSPPDSRPRTSSRFFFPFFFAIIIKHTNGVAGVTACRVPKRTHGTNAAGRAQRVTLGRAGARLRWPWRACGAVSARSLPRYSVLSGPALYQFAAEGRGGMQLGSQTQDALLQVRDAYSGVIYDISLPAGCRSCAACALPPRFGPSCAGGRSKSSLSSQCRGDWSARADGRPPTCSVRELREAVRRALSGREAAGAGGESCTSGPHAERIELLCIDEVAPRHSPGALAAVVASPHAASMGCCVLRGACGAARVRAFVVDVHPRPAVQHTR